MANKKPVLDSCVSIVNDDPVDNNDDDYDVVFFVKYRYIRPLCLDIIVFFNHYGFVHHVDYIDNKNYALVFMTNINSNLDETIQQIKYNLPFDSSIDVAYSNFNRRQYMPYNQSKQYNQYNQPKKYNQYKKYNRSYSSQFGNNYI